MKKFNYNLNYNQWGKYFAKGFKLNVNTQNVHEKEKIRHGNILCVIFDSPVEVL